MKGLLSYAQDERRATVAGINLFFSALLGANLGAMNSIPLSEYFQMVLILAGAVTAVLTLAVSKRPVIMWTTGLLLLLILAPFVLVDDFGPNRIAGELDRLAVTLAVWVVMLLMVRATPSSDGSPSHAIINDDG